MASKRLSKLKSNQLDPSENDLNEEEGHLFNVNGVLSLTTEGEELKKWEKTNTAAMYMENSVDQISTNSSDESECSDDSDERVLSVQSLNTSISRGYSIVQIRERTVNIKFDMFETRIAGGRKKYVLYLLVVTRTSTTMPAIDSDKATIERRYSDFHKLYKGLKKTFPEYLRTIEFPQKKLYGNLDQSLIQARCRLLQQFIQKIYENAEIRKSDIFKKFFYVSSLKQGCQYICGGQFAVALDFLLNGLHLQQKLDLDSSKEVIATLCNVVECYMSLENFKEVEKYSKVALELIKDRTYNIYLVPLLQTLKEACSVLGKSTDVIEQRLKEVIKLNQIEVEHLESLRELTVKRFTKK